MADLFPVFRLPRGVRRRLQATPQPSYKPAPRWDFEKGDIDLDGAGNVNLCNGYEAWAQGGIKASLTERGAPATRLLYGSVYGAELEAAMKLPRADAATALEVALTRCWIANPQTKSVHDFVFDWFPDGVEVQFIAEPVVGPATPQIIFLGGLGNG